MSPSFLLGSISPDAIHMREDTVRDDKKRTHMYIDEPGCNLTQRVENLLTAYRESPESDFVKGYCIHLITDYLWLASVYRPFMDRVLCAIPKEEAVKLYYLETDQVDFNIFNNAAWRPVVWDRLVQSDAKDFHSLLTSEEIRKWRDRTLNWFGGLMQEPKIVPVHITDSVIDSFIDETVTAIKNQYVELCL